MKVLHRIRFDNEQDRALFRDRIKPIATLAYDDDSYDPTNSGDQITRRFRSLSALIDMSDMNREALERVEQLLVDLLPRVIEQASEEWWLAAGAAAPGLFAEGREHDVAKGLADTRRYQRDDVERALELIQRALLACPPDPPREKYEEV